MIDKLIAAPAVIAVFKAVGGHLAKHWKKYAIVGGTTAVAGVTYAVGKSKGHTEGKKEGVAEQAARDKKKMEYLHQKHENDRKRWEEQQKEYDVLLGTKVENQ